MAALYTAITYKPVIASSCSTAEKLPLKIYSTISLTIPAILQHSLIKKPYLLFSHTLLSEFQRQ